MLLTTHRSPLTALTTYLPLPGGSVAASAAIFIAAVAVFAAAAAAAAATAAATGAATAVAVVAGRSHSPPLNTTHHSL
jgi:hypothetical protein